MEITYISNEKSIFIIDKDIKYQLKLSLDNTICLSENLFNDILNLYKKQKIFKQVCNSQKFKFTNPEFKFSVKFEIKYIIAKHDEIGYLILELHLSSIVFTTDESQSYSINDLNKKDLNILANSLYREIQKKIKNMFKGDVILNLEEFKFNRPSLNVIKSL